MTITKTLAGEQLLLEIEGRIDTMTSPQLENELRTSISGVTELIFDFAKVEYISSAGLRVLLSAQKVMNRQGRMVLRHVNKTVMDVFVVTGFGNMLTIEEE
jgi:anti-sigma B factor antagonist